MRRKRTSQKGASAVEFALILPLVIFILFGIIEFSLLMYNKALITNASREGARRGIVYRTDTSSTPAQYDPLDDSEIEGVIKDYLGYDPDSGRYRFLIKLTGTSIPIIPPPTPSSRVSGDILTVTVNYNYQFLVLAAIAKFVDKGDGSFPGSITLSSTTKMRME